MVREKAQAADPRGRKYQGATAGADCFVVARKRGNACGAKGAGHPRRANLWVNCSGRMNPVGCGGRRQPSMGGTSRISREAYVRFCERLGVKFPGPTRRPCGGKGAPGHGHVRGKYGGDIALHNRINETRADSKTGARDAAGGIDHARPSHRHRLAARGLSAHAQRRSHWH
jgi:hypothetical protein